MKFVDMVWDTVVKEAAGKTVSYNNRSVNKKMLFDLIVSVTEDGNYTRSGWRYVDSVFFSKPQDNQTSQLCDIMVRIYFEGTEQ